MTAWAMRDAYPDESAAAAEQSAWLAGLRERLAETDVPAEEQPPAHWPTTRDLHRCRCGGRFPRCRP